MQSTKTFISNSISALDYYPSFNAWQHSQQPSVTLKLLNRHLSYLQNQYKTIAKREQSQQNQIIQRIRRRKSESKVINFEENQVKLPQLKKYKKGKSIVTLTKFDKQNIVKKESQKKIGKPLNSLRGDDKILKQKRRSGSQFSQLHEHLKGEVNQKDIFLHKNKIDNISKTMNLKTIKQQNTFCFQPQTHFKPNRLGFIRKYQRIQAVRS